MDTKQEINLKMFISVRDYLAKFLTLLNGLPTFQALYQTLVSLILQIQNLGEAQQTDKSGNTTSKSKLKDSLAKLAADTARKLFAYATFSKNFVMQAQVDASESKLRRMPDIDLKNKAQVIYEIAKTNIDSLATYKIDNDTQETLLDAINKFNDNISTPRLAAVETTQTTKQLVELFKKGKATIDDLNTTIGIIRLTEVDFYVGYKAARKQVGNGTAKVLIKGVVKDEATNLPLPGAKLTFTHNGTSDLQKNSNGKVAFIKKTAKKGGFNVFSAAEGTYTVTIELPGYKKVTTTVNVIAGQVSVMNILLQRE